MKRSLTPVGTTPINEKWREAVHETLRKTLLYIWEQPDYTPLQARRDAQSGKNHFVSSTPALASHTGQ
ncbi:MULTISPECIES: hypothetical protein [Acetobacter]|uniref:Uncharacterized protein n=1 Tax=Acetobacter cerevisiae TaxID=178900 RepID=A0A149VCR0_9PROT|nr:MULTISPECIES: hypothetical protein [Acetobacter]KXU99743.1 hypothetical protein AD928_02225 [Acetobacter cerevisiae]KXV77947.1 hypothetical protein AD954_05135 [Acetobacter cerevisiae]GBQ07401.1 hypothetical protein AA14362_1309 [Acetobacter cerevisiae DSM 14362]